jgi:hypothetical protein
MLRELGPGSSDSCSMSEVLLPGPFAGSEDAASGSSGGIPSCPKPDGQVATPSSDRQVEEDAIHVKSHSFSMKWFHKLRDVSRLFIAVDRRSLLSIIALCLMQAGLIYLQSLVGPVIGSFYSSIINNDTAAFSSNVQWALFVFACISIADASLKWLSESMEVMWRRSLATELHVMYIHEGAVAAGLYSRLDNPDQRLASEVTQFCSSLSDMLRQTLQGPMLIVYYTCLSAMYSSWVAPASGKRSNLKPKLCIHLCISSLAVLLCGRCHQPLFAAQGGWIDVTAGQARGRLQAVPRVFHPQH